MKRYSVVRGFLAVITLILGLASICWMTLSVFAGSTDKSDAFAILPNQTVQSFLNEMALTNNQPASANTEESVREKLEQLRRMAGLDKDLVLQLLYFDAHAKTERERWLSMAVVKHLAISNETFTDVGLFLLDAEDETMRKQAFGCLTRADRTAKGEIDFNHYENILREKKQNPRQRLIQYMYWRDPQAALLSMTRVYGDKAAETELADQLKGDPKAALQSLSDRPEWWVRLYVAETMKKQPQLRDVAILKKLEKDDNPLVKEKATEITSGK